MSRTANQYLLNNTSTRTRESSIQTRQEKYRAIQERKSFSFGKKRTGRAYKIRLLAIVLITALLTWYIRQNRNNPFLPETRIRLGAGDGIVFVQTFDKINDGFDNRAFIIAAPAFERPLPPDALEAPGRLISAGDTPIPASWHSTPPQQWLHINSGAAPGAPAAPPQWPAPGAVDSGSTAWVSQLISERGDPLGYTFEFAKRSILVWRREMAPADAFDPGLYKEKFDMVVCIEGAPGTVRRFRELLRPRLLVAVDAQGSSVRKQWSNVHYVHPQAPIRDFTPADNGGFEAQRDSIGP